MGMHFRDPLVALDKTELELLTVEQQKAIPSSSNNSICWIESCRIPHAGTSSVIALAAKRPTPLFAETIVPLYEVKKKRYLLPPVSLMEDDVTMLQRGRRETTCTVGAVTSDALNVVRGIVRYLNAFSGDSSDVCISVYTPTSGYLANSVEDGI
jgi:hypothetical protein